MPKSLKILLTITSLFVFKSSYGVNQPDTLILDRTPEKTTKWEFDIPKSGQIDNSIQSNKERFETAKAAYAVDDPVYVYATIAYSNALVVNGHPDQARQLLEETIAKLETSTDNTHPAIPLLMHPLATLQTGREQVDTFRRAITLQQRLYPRDLMTYADTAAAIGIFLAQNTRHYSEALGYLNTALPVIRRELGNDDAYVMTIHMSLGHAYAGFEDFEFSHLHYEQAFSIAQSINSDLMHADLLAQAGSRLAMIKDSVNARSYLQSALEIFDRQLEPGALRTTFARMSLARYELFVQQPSDALNQLEKVLINLNTDSLEIEEQIEVRKLMVQALEAMSRRKEATLHCLKISHLKPWKADERTRPVLKLAPEYPPEARKNKIEGYVVVEYTVDEHGFVQAPVIVKSTQPDTFDAAALEASHKFRYAPRLVDGKPVPTSNVKNKFTFKLTR